MLDHLEQLELGLLAGRRLRVDLRDGDDVGEDLLFLFGQHVALGRLPEPYQEPTTPFGEIRETIDQRSIPFIAMPELDDEARAVYDLWANAPDRPKF